MSHQTPLTGYARLTPRVARMVLAALAVVTVLCVSITISPLAKSNIKGLAEDEGDIALYRAEVDRIHAGEGYYEAIAAELTARGYPTRSVFNWRSPLPVWMLGKMPSVVLGKAVLGVLALVVIVLAFEALAREQGHGLGRPLACALLLTGPALPCLLGDLFVSPEIWAGLWIALSLGAYGVNRPYLGACAGLAAIFFRELAIPYCLVGVALAWHGGRRKELGAWIVGLAAWGVFYGLHCWHATQWITPDARAHDQGWLQLGGAAFVISAAQMNAYLILLPQWITAVFFVAAMLGFAGWHTPLGLRCGLSISMFVLAFGFVGQEFNQYWGSLIAPLLCFGAARAVVSIRDLCNASIGSCGTAAPVT